jgi:PAS domain S-box-containing protein
MAHNALQDNAFRSTLSRRWTSAGIGAFAMLVAGAFIGLMVLDLAQMRADAVKSSQRNTAGLALGLADNMRQTVASIEQVFRDYIPRVDGGADRSFEAMSRVRQELMARLMSLPEVQTFTVFGADGAQLVALNNWPARSTSGADRDYFVAHRDNPGADLYVSQVFHAPSSDRDLIALARGLRNPDGSFAGVFAISIAPEYLQRIYDQAGINRSGALALYREDGTLLVRHPEVAEQINQSFRSAPLFSVHLKNAPVGTYDTISPIDGVRRIASYRKVDNVPFVIAVSESYDEVLSRWHELVGRYIGLGTLIVAAIGVFAFAAHRHLLARAAADSRFRAALDSTTSAFFALAPKEDNDDDFIITDVNIAACSLLGRDRKLLVGTSLSAVAPDSIKGSIIAQCQAARATGSAQDLHVRSTSPSGALRWYRARMTPFTDGVALSLRDITEDHTAREATKAARDTAESANRTKSEFLANMSHELRTPLNAIIGFSESLQRGLCGTLGEKQREYVHDIHGAGQHLLAIINDVLDLSRIESGKAALFEEDADLAQVATSALRMIQPRADEKRLVAAAEGLEALPIVRGDSTRLQQVLLNLLSNAVKFTPDGGRVSLRGFVDADGAVAITVADTGIGIEPSDVPKVLMPFELVESAFSRKYKGTGLGLPLAKRLVEMHEGTLTIESVPRLGTRVTVRLPASRVAAPIARAV